MYRMTHKKTNGKAGYWSPNKKEEVVNRLATYENTGLEPRQVQELKKKILEQSSKSNDGWIPVDEPPKKDYITVFAVDKHDYYFVAVYDKEHGYRTNDVGADVDNIVAYRLFNQYRPERSDNHDGE